MRIVSYTNTSSLKKITYGELKSRTEKWFSLPYPNFYAESDSVSTRSSENDY